MRPPACPHLQLCSTPAFNLLLVFWPRNKKAFPASRFSVNLKALDANSYRATTFLNAEVKWCQHSLDMDALVLGCIQTLQLMVSSKEQVQTVSKCLQASLPPAGVPATILPYTSRAGMQLPLGADQTVACWDGCGKGWMHFSPSLWAPFKSRLQEDARQMCLSRGRGTDLKHWLAGGLQPWLHRNKCECC